MKNAGSRLAKPCASTSTVAAPCSVNRLRIYGHGIGMSLSGLADQNPLKITLWRERIKMKTMQIYRICNHETNQHMQRQKHTVATKDKQSKQAIHKQHHNKHKHTATPIGIQIESHIHITEKKRKTKSNIYVYIYIYTKQEREGYMFEV